MITVNGQVLLRSVIMDGMCQSVVMSYQISNNNILFQAVTMTDNSVYMWTWSKQLSNNRGRTVTNNLYELSFLPWL